MTPTSAMHLHEEPWHQVRYRMPPPIVSDSWDLRELDYGWIIRVHGAARVARFHPVRAALLSTIQLSDFDGERITAFAGENDVVRSHDNWIEHKDAKEGAPWRGRTFLKLKPKPSSSELATGYLKVGSLKGGEPSLGHLLPGHQCHGV